MPFERKLPVNFVDELRDEFGNNIDASHVKKFATKYAVGYATVSRKLKQFQVKKGTWNLTIQEGREILTKALSAPSVIPSVEQNLIPEVVDTFVPFGNFNDVKKIIQSGIFYPAFITCLSGNGKTFSVEQACAKANRELIRVNISIETDEDDLIGGFRLVDGNTVWHNGPVVEALERGAVLLLDEIDLASNKILCLQSILEGISTRRLVHIVKAYEIFGNRAKAITTCISRFDEETKEAFQQLYDKVDADVSFEV